MELREVLWTVYSQKLPNKKIETLQVNILLHVVLRYCIFITINYVGLIKKNN